MRSIRLGRLFLACALLLFTVDTQVRAQSTSDQRTIGLSTNIDGYDDLIHLTANPVSIYVYLNNPGENLRSIDFGLDFDYLGSSSAPTAVQQVVNLITGETVTTYSPDLDSIHLEWGECLPNHPNVTVARLDLDYSSRFDPLPGLLCLGPSANAEPGISAPTYLSCDETSSSCLGPADTQLLLPIIFHSVDSRTPPGCIKFEFQDLQDFGNEFPWECEGSYTAVPVGE